MVTDDQWIRNGRKEWFARSGLNGAVWIWFYSSDAES
jgi:hypothetical protein